MKLENNNKQDRLAWFTLVLLCLLVSWGANPWKLYFINDDLIHVPKAAEGFIGQHNMLRHISELSLYGNALLSGNQPEGYHVFNLIIHLANVFFSIIFFKKLGSSFSYYVTNRLAVAIGGLFAVYAFHSEALFWIICRGASLSLLLTILSWLCVLKTRKNGLYILPASILFILGLFTYESVWVYPIWLLLWYFMLPVQNPYRTRNVRLSISIIWLFFIVYLPIRRIMTGELLGTYQADDVQEFRVTAIIGKACKLLARSFLPPIQNNYLFVLFALVMLGGFSLLVYYSLKKNKASQILVFMLISWLVAYLPYISLGVSTKGYESERYLYFPSFFLVAILITSASVAWQYREKIAYSFVVFIFAYHIFFYVKVALSFQTINGYAKEGIAAIKQVPLSHKIIIQNLPAYGYGVPVFNYGFLDGLPWLVPGRDSFNTVVQNKTNFYNQTVHSTLVQTGGQTDTIRFAPAQKERFYINK